MTESPSQSPSDHTGPGKGLEGAAIFDAEAGAIVEKIEEHRHPQTDAILEGDAPGIRPYLDHQPEPYRLPGFGEPEEDCGEFVIAAMQYCPQSGKTHQFKHNCLRYDCPLHAPYAIRRRAAGSSDAAGVAPKLKAMILRMYAARDEQRHFFHHLFISPPDDYFFGSKKPLVKAKEICRKIMDELGIQGVLAYHPYRAADEDRFGDDRGFWKDFLFHKRDWDAAREQLEFSPHFHVVGVAPYVDISVTEEIEEETGWVIHRRQDDQGRSITRDPGKEGDTDDEAMCRALTYALSHAGVYDAGEQRRLAAWLKGPDVNSTTVYDRHKYALRPKVMRAAEDTLGIASPSLECDCDYHRHVPPGEEVEPHHHDVETGAVSIDTWPWPDAPDGATDLPLENRTELPRHENVEGVAAMADAPGSLRGAAGDVPDDVASSSSSTSSGESDQDDFPECGADLKHISQAGDYILDPDWRETAPYADELDSAYRDYVSYMTNKDVGPFDDVPTLEEEDELVQELPRLPEEADDVVDPPIPPPAD